jgi:GTP-binding protein HflX
LEALTRQKLTVDRERAVLVACMLPGNETDPHDPLGELRSLVDTAGGVTVDELIQNKHHPEPATFIGKGKVEELAERVRAREAQVVIFDHELSPSQIGNIEEVVGVKVLDRSELILDIFAGRARTTEAKLQVELAQMEYTYPRLRAMWSHLERIAGGAPTGIGTRGPGEQQLEIDRRIVKRKIADLRREIAALQERKHREVLARNKEFFTVGLVGYTNAGKSTLFNTATDGDAYADDKLFATLSTRTRRWDLGGGDHAMLSDTVGFVRSLPHHLVASFKATLEEAVGSDMLLLVLDVAHPRCRQQLETVLSVLDDIGANRQRRLLVLNKIDKLDHNADLLVLQKDFPDALPLSAKTGRGVPELVERVREAVRGGERTLKLAVRLQDGKALHFIENRAVIHARDYTEHEVVYDLSIGRRQFDQLLAMGAGLRILAEQTPPVPQPADNRLIAPREPAPPSQAEPRERAG